MKTLWLLILVVAAVTGCTYRTIEEVLPAAPPVAPSSTAGVVDPPTATVAAPNGLALAPGADAGATPPPPTLDAGPPAVTDGAPATTPAPPPPSPPPPPVEQPLPPPSGAVTCTVVRREWANGACYSVTTIETDSFFYVAVGVDEQGGISSNSPGLLDLYGPAVGPNFPYFRRVGTSADYSDGLGSGVTDGAVHVNDSRGDLMTGCTLDRIKVACSGQVAL